jgi:hypothetical protein
MGDLKVPTTSLTTSVIWNLARLAISLAIRSLSLRRPGCRQADGRLNSTCGDAPREHQPDGWCLTSNPQVAGSSPAGGAKTVGQRCERLLVVWALSCWSFLRGRGSVINPNSALLCAVTGGVCLEPKTVSDCGCLTATGHPQLGEDP